MTDRAPSGARLAIVELLRRSGPMHVDHIAGALAYNRASQLRDVRGCLRVLCRLGVVTKSRSLPDTVHGRSCRTPALYSLTERSNA